MSNLEVLVWIDKKGQFKNMGLCLVTEGRTQVVGRCQEVGVIGHPNKY